MGVSLTSTNASLRSQRLEWVLVTLLAGNLSWTTLCLGGYRPETMLVTGILTSLTLIVYLVGHILSGSTSRLHAAGWLYLPFLVYALASVLWVTPVPWLGWHDWYLWANLGATFWVVLNGVKSTRARATLLAVVGALAFVATILAAYQKFVHPDWLMLGREQSEQFIGRASGPFGIPNSLAAFYLLIVPALGYLTLRRQATAIQRTIFGYLGLCCVGGLILTVSRGGWLGLALALVVWPLFARQCRWWWRLGAMFGVLGAILLGGWSLYTNSSVVRNRLDAMVTESGEWTRPIMWQGALKIHQDHRWLGSGAGSYNILFEEHRPVRYQLEPQWTHNDYLNTLSDYGNTGFVLSFGLAAAVWLWLLFKRSRPGSDVPRGATGIMHDPCFWQAIAVGLFAFALQLFVDFHFKIPALGMLFAILAASAVQHYWRGTKQTLKFSWRFRQVISLFAVGGVCAGTWWHFYPHYQAETLRYSSRQALDKLWRHDSSEGIYRETLEQARTNLARSVAIDPQNAMAWSDRAFATALWSHIEPGKSAELGQEAADYASRALAITSHVSEFWIRRAVGNDMQGKWLDAGNDMIQAVQLAPALSSTWFYQGYHLSLQPAGRAQARAALDYCLRLDPSNLTAQRLRQQLATNQ